MSTTNVDSLSGNPTGLLRGKEDNHVGDVAGVSHFTERYGWQQFALELLGDPASLDWPERYHIDIYSELAKFACGASCVALKSKFACAVGDFGWKALGTRGADVYDAAPLGGPGDMPAGKLCHGEGGRTRVDRKDPINDFGRDWFRAIRPQFDQFICEFSVPGKKSVRLPPGRVVHEYLDRPKLLLCLFERLRDHCGVGKIAFPRVGFCASPSHFCEDLMGRFCELER